MTHRPLLFLAALLPAFAHAQGVSTSNLPLATAPAPGDSLQITQQGATKQATVAAIVGAAAPLLSNNLADLPSTPAARANLGLGPYATAAAGSLAPTASQIVAVTPIATTGNLGLVKVAPSGPLTIAPDGTLTVALSGSAITAALGGTPLTQAQLVAEQSLARGAEAAASAMATGAQNVATTAQVSATLANQVAASLQADATPTPVASSGNSQATATVLSAARNNVSGSPGGGVVLPLGKPTVEIVNLSPYPLIVWPPSSGTINGGAVNGSTQIIAFGSAQFRFTTANQWSAF